MEDTLGKIQEGEEARIAHNVSEPWRASSDSEILKISLISTTDREEGGSPGHVYAAFKAASRTRRAPGKSLFSLTIRFLSS
jgi:hypothetical protein